MGPVLYLVMNEDFWIEKYQGELAMKGIKGLG